MGDDTELSTKRTQRQDTRISAYPHTLEEVLEKALQVPSPDGKKRRRKTTERKEKDGTGDLRENAR